MTEKTFRVGGPDEKRNIKAFTAHSAVSEFVQEGKKTGRTSHFIHESVNGVQTYMIHGPDNECFVVCYELTREK